MNWSRRLYLQVGQNWLRGYSPKDQKEIDSRSTPSLLSAADVQAAFGHPRLIIADLAAAERLLQCVYRALCQKDIIRPTVIIHILNEIISDITPVEIRAIHDSVECAGGRRNWIWFGAELNELQISTLQFPSDGKLIADSKIFTVEATGAKTT